MKRIDAPKKQPVPFGINGQRENLPPTTPAGDNTASYDAGFPPVTMILKAAGGLPPKGQDMNQILFELSTLSRWASSGALNSFDAAFSTGVGGYPKGAELISDDGTIVYRSTIDDNTNNPNTGGAGWFNVTGGYLQTANNLSEIATAGASAQLSAMSNIGLARLGIGSTVLGRLSSLDWQQFDFTTGANYYINNADWTNAPVGINYAAGTGASMSVDYISAGNRMGITLIPDTVSNANYVVFRILSVGVKGSRTFTVRQDFTSADTIPLSNGGLGATTAAGGRASLGLGDIATQPASNFVPATRTINSKQLNNNVTLSAADVGAYPSTGGTLNGDMTLGQLVASKGLISTNGYAIIRAIFESGNQFARLLFTDSAGGQTLAYAEADFGKNLAFYVNGRKFTLDNAGNFIAPVAIYENGVRVYSPNNKPSASDVGALPSSGGSLGGPLTVNGQVSSAAGFNLYAGANVIAGGGAVYEGGTRVYSPNNPPPAAVMSVRLSGRTVVSDSGGRIDLPAGCVYTGMSGANYNTNIWAAYSAIQALINGSWVTIGTV